MPAEEMLHCVCCPQRGLWPHRCNHPLYPTGVAPSIRECYRPIPPNMYQEVRELLNNRIQSGVVRESPSAWSATIVLV